MAARVISAVRFEDAIARYEAELAAARAELDRIDPSGSGPELTPNRIRDGLKGPMKLPQARLWETLADLADAHADEMAAIRARLAGAAGPAAETPATAAAPKRKAAR